MAGAQRNEIGKPLTARVAHARLRVVAHQRVRRQPRQGRIRDNLGERRIARHCARPEPIPQQRQPPRRDGVDRARTIPRRPVRPGRRPSACHPDGYLCHEHGDQAAGGSYHARASGRGVPRSAMGQRHGPVYAARDGFFAGARNDGRGCGLPGRPPGHPCHSERSEDPVPEPSTPDTASGEAGQRVEQRRPVRRRAGSRRAGGPDRATPAARRRAAGRQRGWRGRARLGQ